MNIEIRCKHGMVVEWCAHCQNIVKKPFDKGGGRGDVPVTAVKARRHTATGGVPDYSKYWTKEDARNYMRKNNQLTDLYNF
jgi:hypothetical protein